MNKTDKTKLLKLAHETVQGFLSPLRKKDTETGISEAMKSHSGAFVTLKVKNELRGCIGRIVSNDPLWMTVKNMAIAACGDSRFERIHADELPGLHIEISVLTPPKKVQSYKEVIAGKHGVIVQKGSMRGTLLPQVATERNWSREELLGYCSRDKAGIGWDGWRNAEIFTYEAEVFSDELLQDHN